MSFFSEPSDPSSGAAAGDTLGETAAGCPLKTVSKKACDRLHAAQQAIDYAKAKLSYGAGNQRKALETTDFDAYFRMEAARDNSAFNIPKGVEYLAAKNPAAFVAAKAELAQGGNCSEHAYVVYDYLRRNYPTEHVQLSQRDGFDHAFVIIGDPSRDAEEDLVVADAWPTSPTPTLWQDHFAYTADKKKLLSHATSLGDSRDYRREMLDAGLSLNDKGKALTAKSLTNKDAETATEKGMKDGWVWDHTDTAETRYTYETSPPAAAPCGAVSPPPHSR